MTVKYFCDWQAQGHQPGAPTKPVRYARSEPPQISRQSDIPAQLFDPSPLSIGEEATKCPAIVKVAC